ncbi:hypothetical protein J3R30DRAFT_3414059 [Lentinula aciculospora]|uniref:Uncharacterized protein n=1 Tax=Lentinula aciculospora TaxID=153920 RepID=A0A9W9DDW9_9AGAR|nr:hypothetical protein J3R30DRAFT_3414059 [Lentinula aciculospora]
MSNGFILSGVIKKLHQANRTFCGKPEATPAPLNKDVRGEVSENEALGKDRILEEVHINVAGLSIRSKSGNHVGDHGRPMCLMITSVIHFHTSTVSWLTHPKLQCPHPKFLPFENPPSRQGVDVERSSNCDHKVTPRYCLGWYIPAQELHTYFPECGGEMSDFWETEVAKPWIAKYNEKYKNKEHNLSFGPVISFITSREGPHILVFITDNHTQEALNISRNDEYITDAKRIVCVKESFGEMIWIRR